MPRKKIKPTPTQLSDNEQAVQRFIERHMSEHRFSPTVREISAEVGLSVSGTHKVIQRLVEYGYLKKQGYRTKYNLTVLRYLNEAYRPQPRRPW